VWLGTHAIDIGAMSVFLYCFREREEILRIFEMFSGQRMMTSYFRIGGLALAPPRGWQQRVNGYRLSDAQAQAILELRLQRLTGLEQDKIFSEYKEVMAQIVDLIDILANPDRVAAMLGLAPAAEARHELEELA